MLTLPKVEIEPAPVDWRDLPTRFVNPGEIEAIVALLRTIWPRRMAEFGVNTGRTARLILDNVPGIIEYRGIDVNPWHVPSIDFQRAEITLDPGLHVRGDPRFRLSVLRNGTRDLSALNFDHPLDAVFIDGDHSREGVEHDTALAYAVVRPGGLIIWHDYHDLGTVGVADALHDLAAAGHEIRAIAGTWLAYEAVRCGMAPARRILPPA